MNTPHLRRRSSSAVPYDPLEVLEDARRYEDFTTIDWVHDTLLERGRKRTEAKNPSHAPGIIGLVSRTLRAFESWFVLSLAGALIGLNTALSSMITVWLSDLKLGYCTQGWWLNRKFCCREMGEMLNEAGACEEWKTWTEWAGIQWLVYVLLAGGMAFVCAYIVKSFAPYAAGSGISEIKCILAGFIMKGFLSPATLIIKTIAMPIAIASGLSVGKEGPTVHVACATGQVVATFFSRYSRSQAKMREIVTAASAAGVAVAFGSPIGGVLFALEEMAHNFPVKTMWRSFVCALVATVALSAMNPFRTDKLVLFQVHFDRDWHFFEVGFFVIIGIFGGLYGAFVIKYNMQVQAFRRKHLAAYGISEAVTLAVITAAVGFINKFLRIDMNESLDILFRECEGGGDYENLCQSWAQWRMVNSLLLATVVRTLLVVISYGCKVPAGIFVPSMAVGATFGRMVGILVKALYRSHPDWSMFSACDPTKPCITPGTYAFLGAAAGLAGITRITVTVVVIMFELTGALTYILPTMIVVLVTKAVSDQFGKGGIADQMIRFNGYPFLDHHDHAYNVPVAPVMRRKITYLPATGMRLHELEHLLASTSYQGFPIVKSQTDLTLVGDITRSDLRVAIQKAQQDRLLSSEAECLFCESPTFPTSSNPPPPRHLHPSNKHIPNGHDPSNYELGEDGNTVDFERYVNVAPLTVSPKQPLEIVMELFKKLGPRVILIEQHGKLVGLVTVKDCLKYTIAHEHSTGDEDVEPGEGDELEQVLDDLQAWLAETWESIVDTIKGNSRRRRAETFQSVPGHDEDDEDDVEGGDGGQFSMRGRGRP